VFHEHFENKERRVQGVAEQPLKERVKEIFGISTTTSEVGVAAPPLNDREAEA
jgi:hypothetical protein